LAFSLLLSNEEYKVGKEITNEIFSIFMHVVGFEFLCCKSTAHS